MEFRFNAHDCVKLPVDDRIRRCLLLGREARKLAETVSPELAAHFLKLADNWDALASEISAAAR